VIGWHPASIVPHGGIVTVQTVSGDFAIATVCPDAEGVYVIFEDGGECSWSQVKRWADCPADVCRYEWPYLIAKLH